MKEFYHNRRVLVTGAGGFIGSALVDRLVDLGAEVTAGVSSLNRTWRLDGVANRVRIISADLSEPEDAQRMIEAVRPLIIFNLASSVRTERVFAHAGDIIRNTYTVTESLINASVRVGVEKFVQFGSIEEYGSGAAPFNETQREEPISPYSFAKVAATQYALLAHHLSSTRTCVIRPAATFGPRQGTGMLIPSAIMAGIEGKEFGMNAGEQMRDFIYIEDLVDGVLRVGMEPAADGQIINLGSGSGHLIKDIVTNINTEMGNQIHLNFGVQSYRLHDPMVFFMDTSKAQRLLGWRAIYSISQGIEKTVSWYRSNYLTIQKYYEEKK